MAKFICEFEVDNDFYRDADDPEKIDHLAVGMTLQDIGLAVRAGSLGKTVRDENGNTVGSWSIVEDDPDDDGEMDDELLEFYSDIVVTAVEGGISSWARVDDYEWDVPHKQVHAIIVEVAEPDDDAKLPARIDYLAIKNAFHMLRNGSHEGLHESYVKNFVGAEAIRDAGEIDAYDASCIVQLGLWGKVIYG